MSKGELAVCACPPCPPRVPSGSLPRAQRSRAGSCVPGLCWQPDCRDPSVAELSSRHCLWALGCCGLNGPGAPNLVPWHRVLRPPRAFGRTARGCWLGSSVPPVTGLCISHTLSLSVPGLFLQAARAGSDAPCPRPRADAVSAPARCEALRGRGRVQAGNRQSGPLCRGLGTLCSGCGVWRQPGLRTPAPLAWGCWGLARAWWGQELWHELPVPALGGQHWCLCWLWRAAGDTAPAAFCTQR